MKLSVQGKKELYKIYFYLYVMSLIYIIESHCFVSGWTWWIGWEIKGKNWNKKSEETSEQAFICN